jgi:putative phosphoribosyl transferase
VRFADREEAGRLLAEALADLAGQDVVVLAIPRGGVTVAAEVARALDAPLDVVIPRKVGAPGNPELGLGAVAPGVRVLDERLIRTLGVDEPYLEREIAAQEEEIRRRERAYRGDAQPVEVRGKVAVVVDDGVATGGTAAAALRWARAQGASRVILAVPVSPPDAAVRLRDDADDVVVLGTPEPFFAVGQWYERFGQVPDEEVIRLLDAGRAG